MNGQTFTPRPKAKLDEEDQLRHELITAAIKSGEREGRTAAWEKVAARLASDPCELRPEVFERFWSVARESTVGSRALGGFWKKFVPKAKDFLRETIPHSDMEWMRRRIMLLLWEAPVEYKALELLARTTDCPREIKEKIKFLQGRKNENGHERDRHRGHRDPERRSRQIAKSQDGPRRF